MSKLVLDKGHVVEGKLTSHAVDVIAAKWYDHVEKCLLSATMMQGDKIKVIYEISMPYDPHLPRMPFRKRVRLWCLRRINGFKRWFCSCN